MATIEQSANTLEPTRRDLVVRLDEMEWRDSGDPAKKNETTLRGHAAMFNSLSDDLGGFREIIEPGFFRAALRKQPDVRLLLNHNPDFVLARTKSGTLELREDSRGLHVFATVDKTIQWVKDLRVSMSRGDIDQMSFAFSLIEEGGDDWVITEDGSVVRMLRADGAAELYDTSVVTYPAYPATHVDMRGMLEEAIEKGRLPELAEATLAVAPVEGGEEERAPSHPEGEAATDVAPEDTAGEGTTDAVRELAHLKRDTREAVRYERELHLRTLKGLRDEDHDSDRGS